MELSQNSAQLIPLAAAAAQLPNKKAALKDLDVKLAVAETGKLKEIAAFQITLAAEKAVASTLARFAKEYSNGLSLANIVRDYDAIVATAGKLTNDAESLKHLQNARAVITGANEFLRAEQVAINTRLKEFGKEMDAALQGLNKRHGEFDQQNK